MTAREVRVGVIGLGVMGKAHVAAYRAARDAGLPCRLVAVADRNPLKLQGRLDTESNIKDETASALAFDPREVAGYADAAALLADASVDAVSVCTRTETHVEIARAALAAHKHVLVEKPLALRAADVRPLLDAAQASDRICMPAMCMRFWPGWDWLKERVADGQFGAVKSAAFRRLASPPAWARDFYGDPAKSGGALVDLHIHDSDFVRHLFGPPAAVASTGSLDHVTTLYRYGRTGPAHVVAEGGWDHAPGWAFRMRFTVVFERATADFDLSRDPRLLVFRDGGAEAVPLETTNGYDGEIRAFVRAIADGGPSPVSVLDALGTAALLDAERASLERGATVAV